VSGPIRPEAIAHEAWRPATGGQLKGWLGLSPAARSDGETARSARRRNAHSAVARSPAARWWLVGGKVLSVSLRGHREGTGQGGQGQSSPERRRGMEAVEDASGGGVQRRRGSSDDG
jgi:hypothetical protein